MKILEIAFNLGSGGAERLLVDLSNEFVKENEVVVMTLKDDQVEPEKRQFYKAELSDKIKYLNLGLPKGLSLHALFKIYKAIRYESADVVHLHHHGVPMYCIMAILFCRKAKFYQTIHSDIYNGYTDAFYRFLIKTVGYNGRMGFAALSSTNYRDMLREYPKVKGACIVNGRSPIVTTPLYGEVNRLFESFKSDKETLIFIHIARCHPVKNQMLLINSFNKFSEGGANAVLVIIGDGFESSLGKELKMQANDRIKFLGPQKQISDYMMNADAFCMSSSFEGLPITMIEASLSGKPIVSTPVCGAKDIVVDGVNGMKSKDFTMDAYLESLRYVYENIDTLSRNSERMSCESPFSIKECAEHYIEFFKR